MTTAARAVEIAAAWVGYGSVGTNFFNEWYGWGGYQPWCDAFVSHVGDAAGAGPQVGRYAWVPGHIAFFKGRGQWLGGAATPAPGDLVFFCWCGKMEGDHVGLVESAAGGTVNTIEGNVGGYPGSVLRRSYRIGASGILGYGRPAWPGGAGAAAPPQGGDVDAVARDVIAGRWGNGAERAARLTEAGHDAAAVQRRVNELLSGGGGPPAAPAVDELARQVIQGRWGNGADRVARLSAAGHDAAAVQARVNELLR